MEQVGVELTGLVPLAILAVILVVGWTLLRVVLKLTATLFRVGCIIIALIVLGAFALMMLGAA
jgi:hypothetical protein